MRNALTWSDNRRAAGARARARCDNARLLLISCIQECVGRSALAALTEIFRAEYGRLVTSAQEFAAGKPFTLIGGA